MEILIWVVLSILVGVFANSKGRSGIGFTLISLLLSPLIGLIIALIVSKKEDNIVAKGGGKLCPYCKELVKADASVCKHCGKNIIGENQRKIEQFFKNDTYFINITNFFDDDFEKAKKLLLQQYGPKGYGLVASDREDFWKLKYSGYDNTYIQIIIKNNIMKVEVFNVQEAPDLFRTNEEEKEVKQAKSIDNTDRLIELSKLLEKGLLTKEEFETQKKKLLSL